MKAILYKKYGSPGVLNLQHIEKPAPADHEVLVKIFAASVTAGDARMRSFNVPGWKWVFARLYLGVFRPRRTVLGMELSGIIEKVGKNVTRFKAGDKVYASALSSGFGAYAEYKCLPENGAIAMKPENLSYGEAATLPVGAGTAVRFLKKAGPAAGKNILIYGASGSVGTYAVQLARHYGASVTAVCSAANMALVRSLGADHVIDYSATDIFSSGKKYDLVFDAVGKISRAKSRTLLNSGGVFLSVAGEAGKESQEELLLIKQLVEANKLRPVIDRTYHLEEMAEAHRFADTGRKKGNIGIVVVPEAYPEK